MVNGCRSMTAKWERGLLQSLQEFCLFTRILFVSENALFFESREAFDFVKNSLLVGVSNNGCGVLVAIVGSLKAWLSLVGRLLLDGWLLHDVLRLLAHAIDGDDRQSRNLDQPVLAIEAHRGIAALLLRHAADLVVEGVVDGDAAVDLDCETAGLREDGVAEIVLATC